MTLLAFAEHLERSLSEFAEDVQSDKSNSRVTYTATVGKQAFLITVEEQAKDDQEPAIT